MKNLFLLVLLSSLNSLTGYNQETYETEIKPQNDFEISIIQVFPDSFPQVTVVFQAKNEFNEPLWLLGSDDFYVEENGDSCAVIAVRNISENRPLNIGLVFDHSGSMVNNPDQMEEGADSYESRYRNGLLPSGYVMSITYAQNAVNEFLDTDKSVTDSLFFIGFSGQVDRIKALTNDSERIARWVKNAEPGGSTAFYDAVYAGIDSLREHSSQPAIIALTDGQDNSSVYTADELVAHANENNVPIYIIGLGNVNEWRLKSIADQTNGFYYATKDPAQLNEIYLNIKKQLRSIYELDYVSNLDNSEDEWRSTTFLFKNDTLTFSGDPAEFTLPPEVMTRINARHDQIREEQRLAKEEAIKLADEEAFNEKLMYGGIGVGVLLLGIGGFMVYRRRKKKNPVLLKLYPNPFSGNVKIDFKSNEHQNLEILVSNMRGAIVHQEKIAPSISQLSVNTEMLEKGTYLFVLKNELVQSNAIKGVKT